MSAVAMQLSRPADATARPAEALRTACDEFIGMVMFGQVLAQARNSSLRSDLFSSSGQDLFQSQLDDVMLQEASRGGDGRSSMFGGLGESLYKSLGGARLNEANTLDVEG